MFVDDLALISDSVIELQRLFNILHTFCVVRYLVVNTVKTNAVEGLLSRNKVWSYDGKALGVVPCFTYLGVNFTRQLSLTQMAGHQALKGKRVLITLKRCVVICWESLRGCTVLYIPWCKLYQTVVSNTNGLPSSAKR